MHKLAENLAQKAQQIALLEREASCEEQEDRKATRGTSKLLFRLLKAFPFPGPEEGDSTPSSSSPGKALYALVEVLHLDEKIRNKIENLMCQGLLKLKEEQDKLSALREFQEGMMPSFPSPPIFGEVRLIFSCFSSYFPPLGDSFAPLWVICGIVSWVLALSTSPNFAFISRRFCKASIW